MSCTWFRRVSDRSAPGAPQCLAAELWGNGNWAGPGEEEV